MEDNMRKENTEINAYNDARLSKYKKEISQSLDITTLQGEIILHYLLLEIILPN